MNSLGRKLIILLFLVLLFCFIKVPVAFAGTYYVSPTGSTSWPNCTSEGSPCLADSTSTGKQFLRASAGDTVYFLPGTYDPGNAPGWNTPAWNPSNSGSSGSPITFQCLTATTCTLIHNTVGPAIGATSKNYITWDGFKGTKVSQQPMVMFNTQSYGTVKNCNFTGYDFAGDNNSIVRSESASYMLVQNNYFLVTGGAGVGVLTYYADDLIIEKNTFDNTTGVTGNTYGAIWLKGGRDRNHIRYNFINGQLRGIELGTGPVVVAHTGNEVYQNVIINTPSVGIVKTGDASDLDVKIYNNTFYNVGQAGCPAIGLNTNYKQQIWNNIVHVKPENTSYAYMSQIDDGRPTYMDYNIYYVKQGFIIKNNQRDQVLYSSLANWQASGALMGGGNPDTHSYYENPTFANAGGVNPWDYKSSAVHKNNGRGGSYASVIGAYITGDEQIGYSLSVDPPPAPPTGLRITN